MTEPELPHGALSKAIAPLEAQRPVLGSAVVDAALAPLPARQRATAPVAHPRRRQVSVLFLDVVGSTALSQTIDPEDALDVMDSARKSFSERVAARGGKVLQYAGDRGKRRPGAGDGRVAGKRREGLRLRGASPHPRRGAPLHREIAAERHEHLGPAPKAVTDRP